jgi:cyclohexyl-isocyanide hydratase
MRSAFPPAPLSIGIVLFPDVTELDVTGPYEVFARMPSTRVYLMAATLAPVRSEHGLTITPDVTFAAAPALDVICVPGGAGVNAAMEDERLLRFLQNQARHVRYVTSVCTGALVLGAAGLLQGYRATTHWLSLDLLPLFGAEPVEDRVVIDRNRITGGGVTAGIDFGLIVASALFDATVAQEIQLMIEYNPAPPHRCGSPDVAAPDLVRRVVWARQRSQSDRRAVAERAAARFDHDESGFNGSTADGRHERAAALPVLSHQRWDDAEGVAIDSLEPGTTVTVQTLNSRYQFVTLFDSKLVLVKGGARFPEAAIVRLEGATAGGSALKTGWIVVGLRIEMSLGPVRITSSTVRSVSIASIPPVGDRPLGLPVLSQRC